MPESSRNELFGSQAEPLEPAGVEPAVQGSVTSLPCSRTDAGNAASRELGGRMGPEPTRFGDWEKSGRCIDF